MNESFFAAGTGRLDEDLSDRLLKPIAGDDLRQRINHEDARVLATNMKAGANFWTAVHAKYMKHDIARPVLRALVNIGLRQADGNYRVLARIWNIPSRAEYKRFLAFLHDQDCQLPFKDFRC